MPTDKLQFGAAPEGDVSAPPLSKIAGADVNVPLLALTSFRTLFPENHTNNGTLFLLNDHFICPFGTQILIGLLARFSCFCSSCGCFIDENGERQ
eukprot:scaffold4959_cov162-Alexandrium_tamarense.AAC.4